MSEARQLKPLIGREYIVRGYALWVAAEAGAR